MKSVAPYVPEGFDAFWQETYEKAAAAPIKFQLGRAPLEQESLGTGQLATGTLSPDHEYNVVAFNGIDGEKLIGWFADPIGRTDPVPAFLWLQPYGRESVLPNQYGTRKGFLSMSFNFLGHHAFHREKYTPERGYFAEGIEDAKTWIFRKMFQNAVIATRVMIQTGAVNRNRIGAMGMSQGGGMAIWLGAWCPLISAVCADMPFLGAMNETLLKGVYRYPLKELMDVAAPGPDHQEKLLHTISYYDTLNQATRCKVPTQVSVGTKDPSVKPIQVQSIYDALPGEKLMRVYEWGHDWHPDMVDNNQEWLLRHM